MGQEVTVRLTDDIDGGATTAEETVVYALDGVTYNIDLSAANAALLRKDFEKWIIHSRRAGKSPRKTASTKTATSTTTRRRRTSETESRAVRQWAKEQGYNLSERGRIPDDVLDRYHRQHSAA